jgi:hypothetical protein
VLFLWVYRKKITSGFTCSHVWLKLYSVSTTNSPRWVGLRIEVTVSLFSLVETGLNALTQLILACRYYSLPIFGRNVQTALTELMCFADFTVSHVWLKLFFFSGFHWVRLPVGIYRLPTFGRNLLTALTELMCLAAFTVSHVWLKLILRLSFSYGAYLKGLPIFGWNA